MKNTVNKMFFERLAAQADEADIQGLTKLASHLTDKLEELNVRASDDDYKYSSEQLKYDVESSLWSALIKIANFHNINFDAVGMESLIKKYAEDIITDFQVESGVRHGVGSFEEPTLGEIKK